MAEVEIISMLMPSAARVSNIVAATPGFDFMPAPTRLTRAMRRRLVTPRGADLARPAPSVISWLVGEVVVRHGEGDVGDAVVGHVLHDHVDVDVGVGQQPEQAGGDAGLVGHAARRVTLASDVSCVTAETMACSMDGSSSCTQVPGSQVNAERTCSAHALGAGELDRPHRRLRAAARRSSRASRRS